MTGDIKACRPTGHDYAEPVDGVQWCKVCGTGRRTDEFGYSHYTPPKVTSEQLNAPVGSSVWILDLAISGPEPGDFWGWRSTHASKEGAESTLLDRLHDQNVDMSEDLDEVAKHEHEDGSIAVDFVLYSGRPVKVGYGIQRDVVAP